MYKTILLIYDLLSANKETKSNYLSILHSILIFFIALYHNESHYVGMTDSMESLVAYDMSIQFIYIFN